MNTKRHTLIVLIILCGYTLLYSVKNKTVSVPAECVDVYHFDDIPCPANRETKDWICNKVHVRIRADKPECNEYNTYDRIHVPLWTGEKK